MQDIVYFVKDTPTNEELRYSVRSLTNFPHGKVWFYGGCPDGLKPDRHVYVKQDQPTKWANIFKMYKMVCNNEEISEDFWLFNDDFFIMKKINSEKYKVYSDGTLENKLLSVTIKNPTDKAYIEGFEDLLEEFPNGISYETHTPMLFNKKQLKELLIKYPQSPCRRSLYGNYYGVEAETRKDCKIYKLTEKVNQKEPILSTTNIAFFGNSGKIIKSMFKEKTIYEY